MALENLLTSNGDVEEAKGTLIRSFHVMAGAALDYARASLGAATAVLDVAMAGGPCAAVYTNYAEVRRYDGLARSALDSLGELASMLVSINDSEDEAANDAYAEHLMQMSRTDEVSAMLEGASHRIAMANRALPENPQPAARFNVEIFTRVLGAQET